MANLLANLNGLQEDVDLRGLSIVAGATAVVTGATLVLADFSKT